MVSLIESYKAQYVNQIRSQLNALPTATIKDFDRVSAILTAFLGNTPNINLKLAQSRVVPLKELANIAVEKQSSPTLKEKMLTLNSMYHSSELFAEVPGHGRIFQELIVQEVKKKIEEFKLLNRDQKEKYIKNQKQANDSASVEADTSVPLERIDDWPEVTDFVDYNLASIAQALEDNVLSAHVIRVCAPQGNRNILLHQPEIINDLGSDFIKVSHLSGGMSIFHEVHDRTAAFKVKQIQR